MGQKTRAEEIGMTGRATSSFALVFQGEFAKEKIEEGSSRVQDSTHMMMSPEQPDDWRWEQMLGGDLVKGISGMFACCGTHHVPARGSVRVGMI